MKKIENAILQINNLGKTYYVGKENLPIIKGIDLQINKGDFVSILGRSGCGKSTLLNIIAGLDRYEEGTIFYQGKDMSSFNHNDWDDFRKNHIGYIFQNFNLLPHLTALQNIEIAMALSCVSKKEQTRRAKELLKLVELEDRMYHKPSQLSGGQKQRVAIARALANNPQILLADEPTGSVDSKTSVEIMDLLQKLNTEKNMTIIMVTHSEEMASYTDRRFSMLDGKIIKEESREKEAKKPAANYEVCASKNMPFITALMIALTNMRHKIGRNFLTVLGTSIGISSVLIMLGLGIGAEQRVYEALGSFIGDKTIWVDKDNGLAMDPASRNELASLPNVDDVLDGFHFDCVLSYQDKIYRPIVDNYGPLESSTEYENTYTKAGKKPTGDGSLEIVLSEDIAALFIGEGDEPEALIGQSVTALMTLTASNTLTYQVEKQLIVCGISEKDIFGFGRGMIPYETARQIARESLKTEDITIYQFEVRSSNGFDETKLAHQIETLGYTTTTNAKDFDNIGVWFLAIRSFLMLIAGISLVVSGIMIAIVLYTNVVERTREIGTLRAIGARRKDIRRIFLTEAGNIGLLAGINGVLIALVIGTIINSIISAITKHAISTVFELRFIDIIFCLAFSIIVSMVSGLFPAQKAARINVIDALRYE